MSWVTNNIVAAGAAGKGLFLSRVWWEVDGEWGNCKCRWLQEPAPGSREGVFVASGAWIRGECAREGEGEGEGEGVFPSLDSILLFLAVIGVAGDAWRMVFSLQRLFCARPCAEGACVSSVLWVRE